ncbi:hypothetical protein GJAV_G00025230 [Gymnothorax javanicus]|nr:hypothetical protein GJAV_G00025230 [Gymnothorax javanicus]
MQTINIRPFCIFSVAGFLFMLQSSESEIMKVHLGETVILGCNISYHQETIWMQQNTDEIPTVVLISGPNHPNGEVFSRKSISPRFTAVPNKEDETNQLQITNITDKDLAFYYCVGRRLGMPQFGKGARLRQVLEKKYSDSGDASEPEEEGHDSGNKSGPPEETHVSVNESGPPEETHDSGDASEPEEEGHGIISFFKSLSFYTVYACLLSVGQLGMICAVFGVHLRSRRSAHIASADAYGHRQRLHSM